MKPERAKELIELCNWEGFGALMNKPELKPTFQKETPEERAIVVRLWDTMPGYTSYYDALKRIAKGQALLKNGQWINRGD